MQTNRFKFRAWSPIEGNEWVKDFSYPKKQVNRMHYDTHHIADRAVILSSDQRDGNSYAKNVIVMQSTGLVDKNEKEIFEGDILKNSQFGIVEVKFISCSFVGVDNNKQLRKITCGKKWEIIGNIYQNHELLNSENEH